MDTKCSTHSKRITTNRDFNFLEIKINVTNIGTQIEHHKNDHVLQGV